jgi:Tetratricopeptide repeat
MELPLELEAQVLVAAAEIAKGANDWQQSLELYAKALTALESAHGEQSMEVAIVCMDIAEVLEQSGNERQAEKYLNRMRQIVNFQKQLCAEPSPN